MPTFGLRNLQNTFQRVVATATVLVVGFVGFVAVPAWRASASGPTSSCVDARTCLAEASAHAQAAAIESAASRLALTRAQAFLSATTTTTVDGATTSNPTTPTTVPPTVVPNVGSSEPLGVPGSWTATFADEFNGSSLDRGKWNTTGTWECCDGGRSNLPNGELDYKTDGANFSFANGALTIQARRELAPGGQAWTSGQIGSKQAFTYGYIEQRGQFPSPAGFLDAFWTWGAPGTNASAQETDAYEFYSDNHGNVYLTSHATGGGGCQGVALGFDPTAGMHVYGTDIEPTGTDWYIDGVHVCHAAGHPTQAWNIVDYMTVNASTRAPVAAASTTHAEKIIDYIRVWQH
jgi:beta-glucanase (GH16 family)